VTRAPQRKDESNPDMSFLAPLFLFGVLAVGVPVVFHLIRRSSRERIPFSSLMFLQASPPRLTRKNRLQHIVLLLLRCGVLLLLALGFARPFFSKPVTTIAEAGSGQRWVILVDRSASMRREALWQDGLRKAEEILRQTGPGDSVAISVFDRRVTPLVGFEEWSSLPASERVAAGMKALSDRSPGWHETQLGDALIAAIELLEEHEPEGQVDAERRIFVISDFTEGSQMGRLQGYDWPRNIGLALERVVPRQAANAGLQLAPEREGFDLSKAEGGPSIRVINAANSKQELFRVGWKRTGENDYASPPIEIYAPPGQGRVAPAPPLPQGMESGRLVLTGDNQEFDNTVYYVPAAAGQIEVLYLGSESDRDPNGMLFYLQRGFQTFKFQNVTVTARSASEHLNARELEDASVLFVTENLSESNARQVRDFLAQGKTGVLVLKNAGVAESLGRILDLGNVICTEAGRERYAMLGQVDFESALFMPFADPRYSDFTKIHFWRHRQLETGNLPEARVLARFDNGNAALVQMAVGEGMLLVLTSGWHPPDSQLALSTKFVPLLSSILEQSGLVEGRSQLWQVGDRLPLAPYKIDGRLPVILQPDGREAPLGSMDDSLQFEMPGIYTVTSMEPAVRIAVHLPPNESRTAPMALEELEQFGVRLQPEQPVTAEQKLAKEQMLLNAELENQQKLWRWLILGAFVFLMLETGVAGWLTGRRGQISAVR
jgi:hypothetical protein